MAMQRGRHYRGRLPAARNGNMERLANFLGWFSIGLGVAELIAPGAVAKMIGIRDKSSRRTLLGFYGLREIAAGVGILSRQRPTGWVWGRVAGDLMDLATLGSAMSSRDANRGRVATATAAVLAVTALDVYCGQNLTPASTKDDRIHTTKTIIVNRSQEEVYSFWHDFENFPRFMDHLESIQRIGDGRWHWKAKGPAGATVDWDSELVNDQPGSLIAWRSLPGSDIYNTGEVRFERATGGRGTIVRVELEYALPGGVIGSNIAKLFGTEPGQQVETGLRQMKQILETGGIVRSDSSIHSRMHPAQPPKRLERGTAPIDRERWERRGAFAEQERYGVRRAG